MIIGSFHLQRLIEGFTLRRGRRGNGQGSKIVMGYVDEGAKVVSIFVIGHLLSRKVSNNFNNLVFRIWLSVRG